MAERKFTAVLIAALMAIAACAGGNDTDTLPGADGGADPAAGTRPSGRPALASYEGRIEDGVECQVLATADGARYAFTPQDGFGPGDYVSVRAEMADASFCQQGDGTIIIDSMQRTTPPAADRDPARSGGVALTRDYVTGSWVAKSVNADCADPDFQIETGPAGTILDGEISRHDESALVILDQYPRIDLDAPMGDLPIEARGPDGLAIMRPATDAQYDPVSIGAATVEGDGVVFVKCAA
ncbi:DUF5818 domain-containing protein [Alteriqipengyuania lutimaris]|uniref:Lipoprotein n=1 Tax=Alteriqipengyuania lutimaris TaxID=1538146 RepID=A0A395LG48_9SPHN|nr:DUF5818 domain-containing protein [Alteriqipengyuania lutimaris]MBB3035179.1 hypothetical protein [Alteriqipengyuania lutimaris]RDS75792.1 hypothetical protein DL238_13915 [Alteriqipengyuania lutimaris]